MMCRAEDVSCIGRARELDLPDTCCKSYPHRNEPHECYFGHVWTIDSRKAKAKR